MNQLKKQMTLDEQIDLLKDTHGLVISNRRNAKKILKIVNYYTIRGYGEYGLFIDKKTLDKKNVEYKYLPNVTIEQMYKLYLFDCQLKKELLWAIGLIEKSLRINISLNASITLINGKCLGPECYLKNALYSSNENFKSQRKTLNKKINDLTNGKNQMNQHDEVIQHHIKKYDKRFPIWVLIEYLNFGDILIFLKSLNPLIQNKVLKDYDLSIDEFYLCMELLRIVRNKCAHFNRIYARLFHVVMYTEKEGMKREVLLYQRNFHTFYEIFLIIQYFFKKMNLLPQLNEFDQKIKSLLRKNRKILKRYCLGLPKTWKKLFGE